MEFRIGDFVKVLDEDGEGVITGLSNSNVVTVEIDGFEFDYALTHLIKIGEDKNSIHRANEKSFDNVLTSKKQVTPKKRILEFDIDYVENINPKGITEIDLHIYELVDNPKLLSNSEMLQIQIQKMERFISVCLEKRITEFVVIHGVGEGVLKQEVRKVLKSHGNIEFMDADYFEYGYGATHAKIKGLFK